MRRHDSVMLGTTVLVSQARSIGKAGVPHTARRMSALDQLIHLMLIEAPYRKAGCTNGSYSVFDMGYVQQGRLRCKGGVGSSLRLSIEISLLALSIPGQLYCRRWIALLGISA
jgi:hypothetical protein